MFMYRACINFNMKLFNFAIKNSRISKPISSFSRNYFQFKNPLKICENADSKRLSLAESKQLSLASSTFQKLSRRIHETTTTDDELDDLETEIEVGKLDVNVKNLARKLLYSDSEDPVISDLNDCASIQEVLNVYNAKKHIYTSKHITQTILVFSDLYKIYGQVTGTSQDIDSSKFIQKLQLKKEFNDILQYIGENLSSFHKEELLIILSHLVSLGLDIHHYLPQLLIGQIKENLSADFSLREASTFFTTLFKDVSIRPFLVIQELVSLVIEQIDSCPVEDFENLTTCLHLIHRIVTPEMIARYKNRLITFLNEGKLSPNDRKLILNAITFLSIPEWQDENTALISKCMLLLQGHLHILDPNELILMYEAFFKIKEPGELLNEIQRCAITYLNKEIDDNAQYESLHLKLFMALLFFLPPLQRAQYEKNARVYVYYCNQYDKDSFVTLAKILSFVRTSDDNLCEILWKTGLRHVKNAKDDSTAILKLCRNYISFVTDVNNYHFTPFETYTVAQLKKLFSTSHIQYIPAKVVKVLSFMLVYGKDKKFLESLITKLEDNWEQLNTAHCLSLAQSMRAIGMTPNVYFSRNELHRLNKVLDDVVKKELTVAGDDVKKVGILLKSCVLRNAPTRLITKLINTISHYKVVSSRSVESISFCLLSTDILHQGLLEDCMNYIVDNKSNILAYEAAKVLNLSFHLGYQPNNIDKFLDVVINLIIRDQERLSCLMFLQSALALSFYNKLPHSFIMTIFNENFIDKVDAEITNCYSKDKYPHRVRNELMQVNRSVCLMYPEANVPWWHKKSVDEVKNQVVRNLEKQKLFPKRIKTYLSELVDEPAYINEHVISPYGYHIDFELNFNQENKIVKPGSADIRRKVAIILLLKKDLTNVCVQVKGKFQLMKKHLEIMEYEVAFINFSEWINLFHGEQRLDFLSKHIFPRKLNNSSEITDR